MPHRFLHLALASLMLLAATTARAEPDRYVPARPADAGLYQALGERAGIDAVVAGLLKRSAANPRIADKFKGIKLKGLQDQITDQLCELTGGPCHYEGNSMKDAHADLDLTMAHFNALVEDLQQALDEQGVPFRTQNRLLALLAPMYRDVLKSPR
jgi:hemoglobin